MKTILILLLLLAPPVFAKENCETKQLLLDLELLGGEEPVAESMREAAKILWILEETD